MARRRGQRDGWLHEKNGTWLLTYRIYRWDAEKRKSVPARPTVSIGPAEGPGKLTRKQAERFAWDHFLGKIDNTALHPKSTMTLDEFWNAKFKTQVLPKLKKATRNQYGNLWKNWIQPAVSNVRLFELSPDHAETIVGNVVASGRSSATAKHVRKVLSAVFSHAKRVQCAAGDNPASLIGRMEIQPAREVHALTWEQCEKLLPSLPSAPYYAREMALLSIATSMNASEMRGLKWKHLNLTPEWSPLDGDVIPPLHIAVRDHYYQNERGSLKAGKRKRLLPISEIVLRMFLEIRAHSRFTNPNDPVFASRNGTPVNENNMAKRILKPIGTALDMPWLSWHAFRHTHSTLTKTLQMHVNDRMALMGHASAEMTDRYTHEDRERMRAGVEAISSRIWKPETAANVIDIASIRKQKKNNSGNQLATGPSCVADNK